MKISKLTHLFYVTLCKHLTGQLRRLKNSFGLTVPKVSVLVMGRMWHNQWGSRGSSTHQSERMHREQEARGEHPKDTLSWRRPHLPKFLGPSKIGLPFEDQTTTTESFGEVRDSNLNSENTENKHNKRAVALTETSIAGWARILLTSKTRAPCFY